MVRSHALCPLSYERTNQTGRDGWIRTAVILLPKQVPEAARLRPDWWPGSESNRHLLLFKQALRPHQLPGQLVNWWSVSASNRSVVRIASAVSTPSTPTPRGDRRDLNPHDWSHNPAPEPFGHGHTCWSTRADSNRVHRFTGPAHLPGVPSDRSSSLGWFYASSATNLLSPSESTNKYFAHSSTAMPTDRNMPRAVCTVAGSTR